MSKKLQRKQIDLTLSEGKTGSASSDDYGTTNISNINNGDRLEDAFDKIQTIIDKLAPETPPGLDSSIISIIPNGYSTNAPTLFTSTARLADGITSPTVSNIFADSTNYNLIVSGYPVDGNSSNDGYVFDSTSGTLIATLNSDNTVSLTFTSGSDIGTSTSADGVVDLTILGEKDYFIGETGKEGFWEAFSSSIVLDASIPASNLLSGTSQNVLELSHSETGNKTFSFYIEDTTSPVLSNVTVNTDMTDRVSGVATLTETDDITIDYTLENAVKYFFIDDFFIAQGDNVTSFTSPSSIQSQNATINSQGIVNALPNSFSNTNVLLELKGRDVFLNEDIEMLTLSDKRIDTKSIAVKTRDSVIGNGRYLSSSNVAVTIDTGGGSYIGESLNSYDHAISLKDSVAGYNTQLQLLNGNYQYPISVDYTNYDFYVNSSTTISSPDYSTGISEPKRWSAFSYDLTTSTSLTQSFTLKLLDNNGINTSNQILDTCNLYYKVVKWDGAVGGSVASESVWIEAIGNVNASNFNSGDPLMVGNSGNTNTTVYTDSINGVHIGTINENERVLTVGNNITGAGTNITIHIRIGINSGEIYSFSGLEVTL